MRPASRRRREAQPGDREILVGMSLLPDYSRQARTYDRTRAASPVVLLQLREALTGTQGGRLADIGGGTGNYALALKEHGWEDPIVIDRSPQMLAHAHDKGLATLTADAQSLPCPNASFDAAMLVSMLHHVEDPAAALAEARRVLRPNGRLAIMVYTREDIEDLWLLDLFPLTREWMQNTHPARAELLRLLPGRALAPVRAARPRRRLARGAGGSPGEAPR
jgi:demethylmenaquinone methyltransferase/2-methoxy-6-polyprenyl-1,4-benzoquinol methylase